MARKKDEIFEGEVSYTKKGAQWDNIPHKSCGISSYIIPLVREVFKRDIDN